MYGLSWKYNGYHRKYISNRRYGLWYGYIGFFHHYYYESYYYSASYLVPHRGYRNAYGLSTHARKWHYSYYNL